ncbi:MAG: indole-3-glycerol phosphate synthase TrpC [Candidatus Omnitrophica bacterium]|nr:indole-3-glycerol phosphate synthase TrpC [Candidatus Omnitrophota bacterium]
MMLARIIEHKRQEVALAKEVRPLEVLKERAPSFKPRRNFLAAISRPHQLNLIAEIKQASPSAGTIRADVDPVQIAQIYQAAGAQALSVLTDERFFGGHLGYLAQARAVTTVPVLRKDFLIDLYQVYESAVAGADAVLLIADLLSEPELRQFLATAAELGMAALVEVHTEEDLQKALAAGAEILGINNRDLHTFKVDRETTARLIRHVPKGKIVVAESGLRSHEDVLYVKSLGVHAVLIGEAFMAAPDIRAKVREVMGR